MQGPNALRLGDICKVCTPSCLHSLIAMCHEHRFLMKGLKAYVHALAQHMHLGMSSLGAVSSAP
jgi:hypothetical protein